MDLEKAGCFSRFSSKFLSLMRPVSLYDGNTTDQYTLYEHRIRGLSTAIWLTQIQPFPLGAPPREPRILRAYRAIATLLTTNSIDEGPITVTGAPEVDASLRVTIVAPQLLNPVSGSTRAHFRKIGDQKPSISVEKISVENTESRAMQDLPEFAQHGPAPIDIVKHSADIFQNLLHRSQTSTSSPESLRIFRLILSRCCMEVKARLDAAQFLLHFYGAMTLTSVFRGWSPRPEDVLESRDPWEVVEDPCLVHELQQERIPVQLFNGQMRFHFGVKTATRWMGTLRKTLEELVDATNRYALNDSSGPHLTRMAKAMRTLAHLLNTQPIQKIFNSRSLQTQLDMLRKRRSHFSIDVVPAGSVLKITEDERQIGETAGHHVLRYLFSLVSWYKAATVDLPSLMMRLANSPPVLYIVRVPVLRPQARPKMHSPIFIAREELNRFLTSGDIEYAYTSRELQKFNAALDGLFASRLAVSYPTSSASLNGPPLEDFPGSVHSAGVALAVMTGDSSSSSPHPTSPHWVPTETTPLKARTIFSSVHSSQISPEYLVRPSHGGFATSSKRCCYCCSLLDEILSSSSHSSSSPESFSEPTAPFKDHYGIVVPWTPPPLGYGLGIKTLALLERELTALLLGGILKNLDHVFSTTNEARAHLDDDMLASYSGSSHSQIPGRLQRSSRLPTVFEVSESNRRNKSHSRTNGERSYQ
ncbi:hypothetical protein C8R41DRAFT_832256 [Lentinula lateritia]|uniref:Uncharacterized protein n=1 Tax=Lentinula lateritia TaxID=40482 RepID=A0ABQ8VFF8_9AGAR|nr:hypothetical protein C8R41DRAFT_832256 [Lentinula lateritia]